MSIFGLEPSIEKEIRTKTVVALDNIEGGSGLPVLLQVGKLAGGIKLPEIGEYDLDKIVKACRGIYDRCVGDAEQMVVVDGPIYAQSSHIMSRYIQRLPEGSTAVTLAPYLDKKVIANFFRMNPDLKSSLRYLVAGSSEEMSDSDASKSAIEMCNELQLDGVMVRARDLHELDLGSLSASTVILATGVSLYRIDGRPTPLEALEQGADRVVLGRELRQHNNPVKYILEVFGIET